MILKGGGPLHAESRCYSSGTCASLATSRRYIDCHSLSYRARNLPRPERSGQGCVLASATAFVIPCTEPVMTGFVSPSLPLHSPL